MSVLEQRATGPAEEYGKFYRAGEFLPFYVPRDHMPQIDERYMPQFIHDALDGLSAGGVRGVAFEVTDARQFKAHQRINHAKAAAMPEACRLKPIFVSADGYVIDGNHRWWAHVKRWQLSLRSSDLLLPAFRLDLPFDKAVDWALAQPYVYEITPTTPERT